MRCAFSVPRTHTRTHTHTRLSERPEEETNHKT